MAKSRRGRGRLSSIELLPEAADSAIQWALNELYERKRLQIDILQEFNGRLADLGLEPVSSSAFNRYSVRKAAAWRRQNETREITAVLVENMEPGDSDNLTIMVAETIKTLVFELLEASGDKPITPKGAMELARALQAAVQAQTVSTRRRKEVEAEFSAKANKAIDVVAKEKGLSADTVETIKSKILGVGGAS
ncbi:hypothetical protein AUC70_11790 [Methyloceanibacter stevinii]|uniref:Terminase n=1 Tax=Methyloceanibacter stevinii TaxID=1774970 RepID=A0A1E3VJ43_9HYPH|nr:DUF3486 family protein [Methyloceanibacter stevinii]ODR93538.1 hypothetical protein AUC70_11790 [Methyloceanibacter stevinii]